MKTFEFRWLYECLRNYYIKTNRIFNPIRKYTWLVTIIVAIGGLWFPKLGLVVLAIMAALITTSFFNGRFWCGNVCPHGSLFDRVILPISRNGNIPTFFKTKVFVVLFFIFFVWNLSRRVVKVFSLWGTDCRRNTALYTNRCEPMFPLFSVDILIIASTRK